MSLYMKHKVLVVTSQERPNATQKEQKTPRKTNFCERSDSVIKPRENLVEMYKIIKGVDFTVHSEYQDRKHIFKRHGLGINEG